MAIYRKEKDGSRTLLHSTQPATKEKPKAAPKAKPADKPEVTTDENA